MEIERRIELPGNRAAATARAMFPQSRHPVRRGWLGDSGVGWGAGLWWGEVLFLAGGRWVTATFWPTPPPPKHSTPGLWKCKAGRSRLLASRGGLWAETPNFPQFPWAHSYLTSRQGGRGCPERLEFGSHRHILPFPGAAGRPPFVSGLAYLHINEAPRSGAPGGGPGDSGNWERLGVVFLL